MSRIGKKPIPVPKGVTVKVDTGAVEVKGPKGQLRQAFPAGINFELADGHLHAKRATDDPALGKFHGLARSLVANAVTGVTEGFKRELDIVGVGYRAEVKGNVVHMAVGLSHPVIFPLPGDIKADYERVVRSKGADSLALVDDGVCTGCGQQITLNMQNELQLSKLVFCKSCGRLLYLPGE